MKKRVMIWLVTIVAMLVVIAVILLLPGQNELQLGKAKVDDLPAGQAIAIDTKAENFGILKGDLFYYYVDVIYNPQLVSEIDKDNLLVVINMEPFEVRNFQTVDFKLDADTRVFRIQYQLQLIDGETDYVYEFPSIVVRYKPVDSDGYMEYPSQAEPVYIVSRLPDDIQNIFKLIGGDIDLGYSMLRPVSGEVISTRESRLPWIFITIGVFSAAGALSDYALRIVPQRKKEKEKDAIERNTVISGAYASLNNNIKEAASYDDILHQADHIVRLVLFQKEKLDWLQDLSVESLPDEIRETVVSFFESTQKMPEEACTQKHLDESLRYMDKILRFYYPEEVDGWKS